jgi:GNAT superfamily N-acetyltransferase
MVRVRPSTENDGPALNAIYRECRSEAAWLPSAAKETSDFARDTRGEALLVAVGNDGELEGFISVWEAEAFIHHLYVRQISRRKGVGDLLLKSLGALLPKPWRLKCLRANAGALSFYFSQGWKEVASGDGDEGPFAILEQRET